VTKQYTGGASLFREAGILGPNRCEQSFRGLGEQQQSIQRPHERIGSHNHITELDATAPVWLPHDFHAFPLMVTAGALMRGSASGPKENGPGALGAVGGYAEAVSAAGQLGTGSAVIIPVIATCSQIYQWPV
jgi:hypothetical protein